jgi:class 3 adenylate cyclase/tetratricopeptide (TPR) repeat protein
VPGRTFPYLAPSRLPTLIGSRKDGLIVQCSACGADNAGTAKFCNECGARLNASCPFCGAPTTAGQRFCSECGAALASAPGSAATAQRRVCSVLFCDLVGFTPLSESRDAEAVRDLLSRYFQSARTIVGRYGGVVEKFIGDAVMAVWGTPVTTEDDAERAVRAAIDLLDAVAALGSEVGIPSLTARAGVVTGEVAVTLGAEGEGMVVGDVVNTAARVQTAAGPGQVLVDEATLRQARAAIEFADAGSHVLKGKAEPLRLSRAVRVLGWVGGERRVDGLEAPLVGRDIEIRLMKDLFHVTVSRSAPRLVLVMGAAGSGKSRLGWEFEKYIDGLADPVWWHRSRCLSYGDGVAFWALAEMVRQRLGIAEEEPAATALPKLIAGLERHLPEPEERTYVGVRLGRLLGLAHPDDSGVELGREELFAGWRTWLVRLAGTSPVVWLIEDLQHADVALLDFLDHVLDWARTAPIHLLAFSRPELDEHHPGWASGRHRQQILLEPLDSRALSDLLDALVPGMPAQAVSTIARQARGVPLYAIEMVRSLIDREIVVPRDGVYRLVGEVGEVAVPDTLRALLAARLDHLDPAARALMADAAVLGDTFSADALAAVTGRPADEVAGALAALVRRELVTVSADPLSPQKGSYGFSHELLRRVAYESLSRRDRMTRHLAVAAHLRSTFPDEGEEVADVIARHLLDALAAAPADLDTAGIRNDAVAELTRAGDRARHIGAQARAATDYATAAEHSSDLADAARLWELASAASTDAAEYSTAVDQADRAAAIHERLGDARSAARANTAAGRSLQLAGQYDAARERLVRALASLRPEPDLDTLRALNQLAQVEAFRHDPAAARELGADAVGLAEALPTPDWLTAVTLATRGLVHSLAGHPLRAIGYYREAARYAERADDPAAGSVSNNLAAELVDVDPHAAAEIARAALAHAARVGKGYALESSVDTLTDALLHAGDWSGAVSAIAEAANNDLVRELPFVIAAAARVAALRGNTTEARFQMERLAPLAPDDAELASSLAFSSACVCRAEGDLQGAYRFAMEAVGLRDAAGIYMTTVRWAWCTAARAAHQLGDRRTEAELLTLLDPYRTTQLGRVLRAERELVRARLAADDPDATSRYEAGIQVVRATSTPFHLADALLDLAELHASQGRYASAAPLVSEATRIADRLGARALSLRIEQASARMDREPASLG